MGNFEKALLAALLITGERAIPIFIHSPNALAIAGVSEEFVTALIQGLAAFSAKPSITAPAPVVTSNIG